MRDCGKFVLSQKIPGWSEDLHHKWVKVLPEPCKRVHRGETLRKRQFGAMNEGLERVNQCCECLNGTCQCRNDICQCLNGRCQCQNGWDLNKGDTPGLCSHAPREGLEWRVQHALCVLSCRFLQMASWQWTTSSQPRPRAPGKPEWPRAGAWQHGRGVAKQRKEFEGKGAAPRTSGCYRCGAGDHWIRDCPQGRQPSDQGLVQQEAAESLLPFRPRVKEEEA